MFRLLVRIILPHLVIGGLWVWGFFLLPDHPSATVSALYVVGFFVAILAFPIIAAMRGWWD